MYTSKYTQGRFSYFVTVAEVGNITKAAQVLHVSQPSLSQYLTRLEQDLGVKLLNRNCTPIVLTRAGTIYLEYVRSVLSLEKKLKEDLALIRHQQEHTLTVGCPSQLIPLIFASCIQSFIRSTPGVHVKILEGTSITVKKMLQEGTVDVAFFHTVEKDEPGFLRQIIQQEELLLAVNAGSTVIQNWRGTAKANTLLLKDEELPLLRNLQVISLGDEYYLHHIMAEFLRELGTPPQNEITVPNIRAIGNYISHAEYNGVTILPNFISSQLSCLNDIVYLRPQGHKIPVWYLTVNVLSGSLLSECAKLFWKSIPPKIDFL